MAVFQQGSEFTLENITATYDKLPQGVYQLMYDPRKGYFLNQKVDFSLPSKIYGNHSIVDRWLTSYISNPTKNLGVILSGLKGTGKTITAQMLCIKSKLPVILITEDFSGADFVDFMSSSELGECIVFIDEYEKVYSRESDQTDFLSLMDGNFKSHRIFLLTVNTFKINEFLVNRPSRIKYRKNYNQLENDVIEEIIEDMLINKDFKKSIYDFFDTVEFVTYDMLISIINEVNLFNEDAITCGKHFNLEIDSKYYEIHEVLSNITSKPLSCSSRLFNKSHKKLPLERDWRYNIDSDDEFYEQVKSFNYNDNIILENYKINKTETGYEIIISEDHKIILTTRSTFINVF